MNAVELFEKVEADAELEGVGIEGGDKPALVIRHKPSSLVTRAPFSAIESLTWDELRSVLTGEREPVVLKAISRIVGYFSRIENWNASKLGELKDRHKGNYMLGATP